MYLHIRLTLRRIRRGMIWRGLSPTTISLQVIVYIFTEHKRPCAWGIRLKYFAWHDFERKTQNQGIASDCLSSCTTSLMNVLMIFLCALSSCSMFL